MKKILLFLCFFTSFTFYSQIDDFQNVTPLSFVATTNVINYTGSCDYLGTITISASGGEAPYTYSQDGVNYVSNNVFDLPPDLYTMYAKDSAGSVIMQEVMLYGLKDMSFDPILSVTNVSCNGGNDGSIIFDTNVTSGTYIYSINGGKSQTGNIILGLTAGTYSIGVSNTAVACGIMIPITITEPPHVLNITASVSNVSCSGNKDGSISASVTGGKTPYFYSIDGADYVASNTFNMLFAGTYSIKVKDSDGACSVMNDIIITEPRLLTATIVVENQTITINTTGGNGEYQYSFDQNPYQLNNIFNNASYGHHLVFIRDQSGCTMDIIISVYPPAPLINGKSSITIEFKPGQTLGDVVVEGQNIKWYSNANNAAKKTNKSTEATLPVTTLLVDGTIYYASQTINGIESTQRLAVTAKVSGTLATPDFALPNFSYYPNPVQHTLSISNTSNIDEVEIFSVSGKSILTKKINSDHSEIDLSHVSSGFYFLKVKAEGQTKTIKIVKK